MYHRSSSAHHPQVVRQCTIEVPLPTTPRQSATAPREFQCPLPQGKEVVYIRSSTAHCHKAVWWCTTGLPLPIAPGHCGTTPWEFHYPLHQGREAMYRRSSTAHYFWGQCGSVPVCRRSCVAHCPKTRRLCREEIPRPTVSGGSAAMCHRSSTAHCPWAVWQLN